MQKIRTNKWLILILVLAGAARLCGLSVLPEGMMPDEAYGAYNAYALMTEGIDSRGYVFPVYFIAWGSGMNVLYSYLAIPFFRILGVTALAYRLPQAIVGILSVFAAYVLGKELKNQKFGLLFAFVLAINPWHIMITRFGLESDLAPGMFLIALTFLMLGMKRVADGAGQMRYFILAAIFSGATLYAYALSWIMIPVFLLLFGICFRKQLPEKKVIFGFCGVLFLLAFPLLWFVGVNLQILPEIRTSFFSIPRLGSFRSEELGIGHVLESIRQVMRIILTQYDGKEHTSSPEVGAYYYFTTPFLIVGICRQIYEIFRERKKRKKSLEDVWMLWLVSAGITSILNQNITTIHINLIHIPVIFFSTLGFYYVAEKVNSRWIWNSGIAFWLVSFCIFGFYYITQPSTYFFGKETEQAIKTGRERAEKEGIPVTIVENSTIKYSLLLWYEKPSAREFSETVVYTDDLAWAEIVSYDCFQYIDSLDEVQESGLYLIPKKYRLNLLAKGYQITDINDSYSLAER